MVLLTESPALTDHQMEIGTVDLRPLALSQLDLDPVQIEVVVTTDSGYPSSPVPPERGHRSMTRLGGFVLRGEPPEIAILAVDADHGYPRLALPPGPIDPSIP